MRKFTHLWDGKTALIIILLMAIILLSLLSKPHTKQSTAVNHNTNTAQNCSRNNGYYKSTDGDWVKCPQHIVNHNAQLERSSDLSTATKAG